MGALRVELTKYAERYGVNGLLFGIEESVFAAARGSVVHVFDDRGIRVLEYSPASGVWKTLGGYSSASMVEAWLAYAARVAIESVF